MPEPFTSIDKLEKKVIKLLEKLNSDQFTEVKKDFDEKFLTLASIIESPILLFNNRGKIVYLNRKAKNIFPGLEKEDTYAFIINYFAKSEQLDLLEKLIFAFINRREQFSRTVTDLNGLFENGTRTNFTVTLKTGISNEEPFCVMMINIPEVQSKINKSFITLDHAISQNIYELESKTNKLFLHAEELKKSKEELAQKNSTKDKFFSIIAHDLRAPFNAILGITEILKNEADGLSSDEIKEMAKRLFNSSKNVLEMVEDLLDWARLQGDSFNIEKTNFSIEEVVLEVLFNLKNNALRKKISISTQIPEEINVSADRNMVSLIVRNLLSNAIKFTKNGGSITIKAKKEDNLAVLSVIDNGVGIKKENLELILKMDHHYSELGTNKEKGTGLGLILCNEFINKNDGKLYIESEFGVGSKFSITIPLAK